MLHYDTMMMHYVILDHVILLHYANISMMMV